MPPPGSRCCCSWTTPSGWTSARSTSWPSSRAFDPERAVLLLASREEAVPARFDRDFHLVVGPLELMAAVRLLDAPAVPPAGQERFEILQQAAGNPLALNELSRALARDGSATAHVRPLPLTSRLENLFAADLPTLPLEARRALLLVATAGTTQAVGHPARRSRPRRGEGAAPRPRRQVWSGSRAGR